MAEKEGKMEEKKANRGVSRRTFLKVAAGTAAVAVAGGIAWHMLRPVQLKDVPLKNVPFGASAILRGDKLVEIQSPDGGLGIRRLSCVLKGRTGQTCVSANPARAMMSLYDATGYVRHKRVVQGMVHWLLYVNKQNPDGSWHQFQDIHTWHAVGTSLAPDHLIHAYRLLGDESGLTKAELDYRVTRAAEAQTDPDIATFTFDPAPHWPHERPAMNSARPIGGLIEAHVETGERRWLDIARASVDWLIDEHQAQGGYFDVPNRDIGQGRMLDHALLRLYPVTGDKKYLDSAVRCCDFLLTTQRPENSWSGFWAKEREPVGRQDGGHAGITGIIARAMVQTYWYTGDERYLRAAERAINWLERVMRADGAHGMFGLSLNLKSGCVSRPIAAILAYLRVKGEIPMYGPTNGLCPLSWPVKGR